MHSHGETNIFLLAPSTYKGRVYKGKGRMPDSILIPLQQTPFITDPHTLTHLLSQHEGYGGSSRGVGTSPCICQLWPGEGRCQG